jgi:hypothetical protein
MFAWCSHTAADPQSLDNDSMSPAQDRMSESLHHFYLGLSSSDCARSNRLLLYTRRSTTHCIHVRATTHTRPETLALQLLRRVWPFLAPFRAQLACLSVVVLFSIPLNLITPLPSTLAVWPVLWILWQKN